VDLLRRPQWRPHNLAFSLLRRPKWIYFAGLSGVLITLRSYIPFESRYPHGSPSSTLVPEKLREFLGSGETALVEFLPYHAEACLVVELALVGGSCPGAQPVVARGLHRADRIHRCLFLRGLEFRTLD